MALASAFKLTMSDVTKVVNDGENKEEEEEEEDYMSDAFLQQLEKGDVRPGLKFVSGLKSACE